MGCFKTTSGGSNWFRWNDGMPEGNIVSDMKSYFTGGDFYVLAGTYGRGMWTRKDDELLGNGNISTNTPDKFELYQNYPNPFNPSTSIKFSLPADSKVQILVYGIAGNLVRTVLNDEMNAGIHSLNFDGADLSSGVYFYKMISTGYSQTRKMILIK